jgi:hypothetical protein
LYNTKFPEILGHERLPPPLYFVLRLRRSKGIVIRFLREMVGIERKQVRKIRALCRKVVGDLVCKCRAS